MSDTKAMHIIQPEAHTHPLLTTQHQRQATTQVPVMQDTEGRTLVTRLTRTGMTAVPHRLRTHLLDTENSATVYQHHHSLPSHRCPYNHKADSTFFFLVEFMFTISVNAASHTNSCHHTCAVFHGYCISSHLNSLQYHTTTFGRNICSIYINSYLQCAYNIFV
jgi:hypothetical protein